MSDDNETILALLEEKASFHAREADRYRSAIRILRGEPERVKRPDTQLQFAYPEAASVRRRKSTDPKASTQAMVEKVLARVGHLTYKELTEKMLEDGWVTESVTPSNTVRTALGRMSERGIVGRNEEGEYYWPAIEEEAETE